MIFAPLFHAYSALDALAVDFQGVAKRQFTMCDVGVGFDILTLDFLKICQPKFGDRQHVCLQSFPNQLAMDPQSGKVCPRWRAADQI
jgi:hypothetical protein